MIQYWVAGLAETAQEDPSNNKSHMYHTELLSIGISLISWYR